MIGAHHKQAIVTLAERKCGFAVIAKIINKISDLVDNTTISQLKDLTSPVNTIIFDNGREFAKHSRIETAIKSTTYFADPFTSWQRGSNENFNGLLRQYIPKKRPLSSVNGA